jgi:hypothetical protein
MRPALGVCWSPSHRQLQSLASGLLTLAFHHAGGRIVPCARSGNVTNNPTEGRCSNTSAGWCRNDARPRRADRAVGPSHGKPNARGVRNQMGRRPPVHAGSAAVTSGHAWYEGIAGQSTSAAAARQRLRRRARVRVSPPYGCHGLPEICQRRRLVSPSVPLHRLVPEVRRPAETLGNSM